MAINSTNVRSKNRAPWILQAGIAALDAVAPSLAERWSERLFLTPPRHPAPERERKVLREAAVFHVPFRGGRLRAWHWGNGPTVLLVHGWGGRGGQMTPFVSSLRAAGFSAVTFDAPAHGASSGRLSSVPLFGEAVRAVAHHVGGVPAVIAHSMGAAGSAVALHAGLQVGASVFVAPPSNPADFFKDFADALGLSAGQGQAVRRRIEKRFGVPFDEFDVPRLAQQLTVPLLVIHDESDAEVPWTHGEAVARAWPGAELVTTAGLGHRRVLRDASVIDRAVAFLAARVGPTPSGPSKRSDAGLCSNPSCDKPVGEIWDEAGHGDDGLCASCALSQELFFRSARSRGFPRAAA